MWIWIAQTLSHPATTSSPLSSLSSMLNDCIHFIITKNVESWWMFRMFSSNSDTPLPSFHTNKNNNKASCINSRGKSWLYYLLPNFFSLMACSVFFESVPDFMIWKGLIKIAWLYHLTRKHFPILQSITIDSIHHLLMDYSIVEFMISFFRKNFHRWVMQSDVYFRSSFQINS